MREVEAGETVEQWLRRWSALRAARHRKPLGISGVLTAAVQRGRTTQSVAAHVFAALFNNGRVPVIARHAVKHPATLLRRAGWLSLSDAERAMIAPPG